MELEYRLESHLNCKLCQRIKAPYQHIHNHSFVCVYVIRELLQCTPGIYVHQGWKMKNKAAEQYYTMEIQLHVSLNIILFVNDGKQLQYTVYLNMTFTSRIPCFIFLPMTFSDAGYHSITDMHSLVNK